MADKYTVGGNKYDEGGALMMQPDTAKNLHIKSQKQVDPKTRLLTGDSIERTAFSNETSELKKYSNNKVKVNAGGLISRVAGAISNRMLPLVNFMTNPATANINEDWTREAWEEQHSISQEAQENLAGTSQYKSKLLSQHIADQNAKNEILSYSANGETFHVEHYDALYGQNGIMYKDPHDLTEAETRYGLGYTRSIAHLFDTRKSAESIARKLIEHDKNFATWYNYKGPSEVYDSVMIGGVKQKFPKLVTHGTYGSIDPNVGFWNRRMATDPNVLEGKSSVGARREMASHVGSLDHAMSRTWEKGDYEYKGEEEFHNIKNDPSKLQSIIIDQPNSTGYYTGEGTGAKYYTGFIKSNNPLKLPDLDVFEFEVILENLEETMSKKGGWTYSNVGEEPTKEAPFPSLTGEVGSGTAVDRVMEYARAMMEKDYAREGLEPDNWGITYEEMTPEEQGEVNYYKMHGLIQFINSDLEFDSIEYNNSGEDSRNIDGTDKSEEEREPSYILFHPWQFKSIYNNGEYKPRGKNFLSKTSKYKKKEQVA
jgi:hypothetical protein